MNGRGVSPPTSPQDSSGETEESHITESLPHKSNIEEIVIACCKRYANNIHHTFAGDPNKILTRQATQAINKLLEEACNEAELRGRVQEHKFVMDNYFKEYVALANAHDFKLDSDKLFNELTERLKSLTSEEKK